MVVSEISVKDANHTKRKYEKDVFFMGKKFVDPRITSIIEAVEQEHEPIYLSQLAQKVNIEEQELKNIIGGYIRQQKKIMNIVLHKIDPGFFTLVYGLKECTENKGIQAWMNVYHKMTGA